MKKLLLIMPSALILHFLAGCFFSLFVRNPMSIEKLGVYYILTFPLLLLLACILYTIINLLQSPRRVSVFIIIATLIDLFLLSTFLLAYRIHDIPFMSFLSDILGGYENLILVFNALLFIFLYLEVVSTFIKNRKGEISDFETDGMKTSTLVISSVLLLYFIVVLIISVFATDSPYLTYFTLRYDYFFPLLLAIIVVAKAVIKLVFRPHRCNIFALLSAISSVALIILYILQPEFTALGYHLNTAQILGLALVPLCILMYLDVLWKFEKEDN